MEEVLLELEQKREVTGDYGIHKFNDSSLVKATQSLVEVLNQLLELETAASLVTASSAAKLVENDKQNLDGINTEWLMNICEAIPSEIGAENLALSVVEASNLNDETQQQASLFDVLGSSEEAMSAMFELVPVMSQIRINITETSIRNRSRSFTSAGHRQQYDRTATYVDVEEERRQHLLREAQETAHIAAITRAEADAFSSTSNTFGATHTITRTSEKEAQKAAKKAAKRAAQALAAAKAAGAIVDDSDLIKLSSSAATMGSGGLMNRTNEELWELQHSLLPEGSKEYYNKQGLPKGTEREYFEGYEKVTIPAPRKEDIKNLHRRLPINEVIAPDYPDCSKAFAGTATLNPMQSTVFQTAFHHRDNMLVCAPTGAGKTNVAMLTVVAHFRDVGLLDRVSANGYDDDYDTNSNDGVRDNMNTLLETGHKVVYIAPMKALAQEVVSKFDSKLKPLKLIVRELTGDMQLTRAEAESANVIVTTPEKWDVVTRKSGNDENSLGNQCGLLIIDEVHLLADDRGAVIESVVARLHRLVESRQRQVRIVGLSATLPNYQDVATFLQVPERGLFFFGPEHRPVPLEQNFIGVTLQEKQNRFLKEQRMNDICYDIVVDSLRRGYQVMVFVHSRKGTGETASALAERAQERSQDELERYFRTQGKDGPSGDAYNRHCERAKKSRNREVSLHFENGMGIHHAGMLRGDRKLTEQMFSDGAIKVLCCTATLAWGINLPAHTVVVKGTEVYNPEKGGNVDLSILDVQQIFGRAGRPQFDSSGEATLITTHDALARYLDKLVRAVPIESTFIKQLADHLNAEVVGGTVTNIQEAATWLTYTYLHVRMMRNPLAYGINADQKEDDPMLRGRSLELVKDAAKLLDENRMLRYHVESGNLAFTDLGRVAAHFYIQEESVKTFNDRLSGNLSPNDADLMHLICCATEFENVKVRQEELGELDSLATKVCPLEVKTPIHDSSDKSLVLMQAFISRANIKSFTLISDTNYIASNAGRVARAMFEMCIKQNQAGPALKLLRMAKSVDRRIWWFQSPLRHFEGEVRNTVFDAIESRKIGAEAGYDSFEAALSLLDMQPEEVGQLCHWHRGGEKVQRLVRLLPYVEVDYKIQPVTSSVLRFQLRLDPLFEWQKRWHGGAQGFWVWVEDGENNRIFHNEYVIFSHRTHPEPVSLDLNIPAFDPLPKQYFVRIVSDSWVGVESLFPISFGDIKMPSQTTPYTNLMDLTPLPTTALQEPKYEQLYSKFETFNPIQTQLFHVLYHTSSPILLGAPTGSGKTIVAELALLRMKKLNPKGICVYIAPLKSLARERLKEWRIRLGSPPLKWNILELSGDTHHDKRALSQADVLVCTPEKWDLISRGWRGSDVSSADSNVANGKAFIKKVRLLVIDEIHLLGEERGAVLEAIVSRTRFISRHLASESNSSNQNSEPLSDNHEATRIIGLSTALANPYDLAEWIGIDTDSLTVRAKRGLYNFRPSVRPIPMEVHMQGFPGKHYCPRMATMNKPCYSAIKEHSPTKPVIIFVASRRQTRLTAMDIISYAAGDENPRAFLGCSDDYIESIVEKINDNSLRHTIAFGIGLHHAGLSSQDREIVENLFLSGDIRVLVATATLAWGVNLPAHFVIVKGTEYFDGKSGRYVDYPLTDVLQMMGRAGRPQFDTSGVALVMVEESKKNFYKKFLYAPFPVESCLADRICVNLNAEIAIGTIKSLDDAVGYLSWTFFARRVKANPSYYGAESDSDADVQKFLSSFVEESIQQLAEHSCVEMNQSDIGDHVQPTILGKAAANYYLDHRSPKQMQFGIKEARKLVMQLLDGPREESSKNLATKALNDETELKNFSRESRLDEVMLAWILYALSSTHEFDELPVRHNEEFLNAELSKDLPWGPDTSGVISSYHDNGNDRQHYANLDVMADPHTKCFLLLQAYLTRSKLPISDYINDTKTVLDQVPRLLAAMQYIAMDDQTVAGNFELVCQFSRTKQLLLTRSMAGNNPMCQLLGISKETAHRFANGGLKKKGGGVVDSLRVLRAMPRSEAHSLLKPHIKGNVDAALKSLYSIPLLSLSKLFVYHQVDKASGASQGVLTAKLRLEYASSQQKYRRNNDSPLGLSLVLGSLQRRVLLAHNSLGISRILQGDKNIVEKEVTMKFDWNQANADGGEDGGSVILRIFFEEIRGMDSEVTVKLR